MGTDGGGVLLAVTESRIAVRSFGVATPDFVVTELHLCHNSNRICWGALQTRKRISKGYMPTGDRTCVAGTYK
jgi:hypothetical protein